MAEESRRTASELGLARLLSRTEELCARLGRMKSVSIAGLTPRELEFLRNITEGKTNQEISRDCFISEHTVANHVRHILEKTGASNRTDAAAFAIHRGISSGR